MEAMAWCNEGHEKVGEEGMVKAVRADVEEEKTHAVTQACEDRTSRSLVIAIREGFTEEKSIMGEDLRPFYSTKEELYKVEEVLFLLGHMLRKYVLDILH